MHIGICHRSRCASDHLVGQPGRVHLDAQPDHVYPPSHYIHSCQHYQHYQHTNIRCPDTYICSSSEEVNQRTVRWKHGLYLQELHFRQLLQQEWTMRLRHHLLHEDAGMPEQVWYLLVKSVWLMCRDGVDESGAATWMVIKGDGLFYSSSSNCV